MQIHTQKHGGWKKILCISIIIFFTFQIFTSPLSARAQVQGPTLSGATLDTTQAANPVSLSNACNFTVGGAIFGQVDITCAILNAINDIADSFIVGPFLSLSQNAVGWSLAKNRKISGNDSFVQAGWPVVRDIANIFFVFILLWIALSTIFEYEPYSAKNLLPRFIISAVLINFSLPIAALIVSVSNQGAEIFFNQLNIPQTIENLTAPAKQIIGITASQIKTSATPQDTPQQKYLKMEAEFTAEYDGGTFAKTTNFSAQDCDPGNPNHNQAIMNQFQDQCKDLLTNFHESAKEAGLDIMDTSAIHATLAKQIMTKLILLPIIMFVLLAVAVLLIVRYVSLLFIMILGPLAFLFRILPGTRPYWDQWIDTLIKWSLFSPAFAVCFTISARTIDALNQNVQLISKNGVLQPSIGASFLDYLLAIAFMVGSLIVAQKLGIAGAGTAISMGNRAAGAIGNYAKRGALAPVRFAGTIAKEASMTGIGRLATRLQQTPAGQLFGVRNVLAETATASKAAQEAEYKRKFGNILKGTDESVANYLYAARPEDAKAILSRMDPEDRAKKISKLPIDRQIKLGEALRSQNAESLVAGVSNNPEVMVKLMNPGLQENTPEYKDAIKERFGVINKRSLDPGFIENMDPEMLRQLKVRDISDIGSSAKGAEALSKAIKKNIEKMTPQGPGSQSPFSDEDTRSFMNTVPGRAIIGGRMYQQEKGAAEKLAEQITKLQKEVDEGKNKPSGGEGGQAKT